MPCDNPAHRHAAHNDPKRYCEEVIEIKSCENICFCQQRFNSYRELMVHFFMDVDTCIWLRVRRSEQPFVRLYGGDDRPNPPPPPVNLPARQNPIKTEVRKDDLPLRRKKTAGSTTKIKQEPKQNTNITVPPSTAASITKSNSEPITKSPSTTVLDTLSTVHIKKEPQQDHPTTAADGPAKTNSDTIPNITSETSEPVTIKKEATTENTSTWNESISIIDLTKDNEDDVMEPKGRKRKDHPDHVMEPEGKKRKVLPDEKEASADQAAAEVEEESSSDRRKMRKTKTDSTEGRVSIRYLLVVVQDSLDGAPRPLTTAEVCTRLKEMFESDGFKMEPVSGDLPGKSLNLNRTLSRGFAAPSSAA